MMQKENAAFERCVDVVTSADLKIWTGNKKNGFCVSG